jgi:hypothetical protein
MTDPPVRVEVASPLRYDRAQLAARVVFAIVLGWLGISVGWVSWLLYLVLPLIAAIEISMQPREYPARLGPPLWRGLAWLLQLSAYMMFLTDRFPLGEPAVRFEVDITARPTVGSSLLRLVTSIPSAIVLCFLSLISGVMWLISAIGVLVVAHVPDSILGFQRGVLRWQARLVAYHASLVDDYPPFMLDTHGHLPPARGVEQPA